MRAASRPEHLVGDHRPRLMFECSNSASVISFPSFIVSVPLRRQEPSRPKELLRSQLKSFASVSNLIGANDSVAKVLLGEACS